MKGEYIRKQDAVDMFNRAVQDVGILDADDIEIVFGMLLSADVAPVLHGRWVWKPTKQYCPPDCWYPPLNHEETWDEKNGTWLEDEIYCSECDYHNYHETKYNFCPHCGARMDGGENG